MEIRRNVFIFFALASMASVAIACSDSGDAGSGTTAAAPVPTPAPTPAAPAAAPAAVPADSDSAGVHGAVTTEGLPPMLEAEEAEAIALERLEEHKPYDWGQAGRLDPEAIGQRYVFEGLGVSIERPAAWTWLPETSAPRYASLTDPAMRTKVDREHWDDPARTPLIAAAPNGSPVAGSDPALRVFVRPLEGAWRMYKPFFGDPLKVLEQEIVRARADHPDGFEIVEAPAAASHSGISGSSTVLRYDVTDNGGAASALEETIWYLPRPPYLFFVRISRPANADAEATRALEETFGSLAIENGGAG